MNFPTKKEILEKTKELQEALIAFTEIDEKEVNIKLEKQKLQKKLSLIKDEVRLLTQSFN